MFWAVYAFLTAFMLSLRDVVRKKSLAHVDEYVVTLASSLFALPFTLPLLFFVEIPNFTPKLWILLLSAGILNSFTTLIFVRAINNSDLSLISPIMNFTTLFTLLSAYFILGESPSYLGLVGIILLFVGAYLLNLKERHKGHLEPLKALLRDKGAKLALTVAFIYSITSNIHKVGIASSSPVFWAIMLNLAVSVFLLPVVLFKSKNYVAQIKTKWRDLASIAMMTALSLIFNMIAFSLTLLVYVSAIKRTTALMGVLFGKWFFNEKHFQERLLAAIIMMIGVAFILFG